MHLIEKRQSEREEISCTKWRSILCLCLRETKRETRNEPRFSYCKMIARTKHFPGEENQNHKFLNYCRINDIKWRQSTEGKKRITSVGMALVSVSISEDNMKREAYMWCECFEFDSRKEKLFFIDTHRDQTSEKARKRDFRIVALVCLRRTLHEHQHWVLVFDDFAHRKLTNTDFIRYACHLAQSIKLSLCAAGVCAFFFFIWAQHISHSIATCCTTYIFVPFAWVCSTCWKTNQSWFIKWRHFKIGNNQCKIFLQKGIQNAIEMKRKKNSFRNRMLLNDCIWFHIKCK